MSKSEHAPAEQADPVESLPRAEPLPELPPPGDAFEAADLTLYRSTLRPQGALYEPLARTEL